MFKVKISRLPLLGFITTKTENRFVISLDPGYVLHFCNAEKRLIYSHDVTECVRLRGDRIYEICSDQPQHGNKIETLL